MNQQRYDQGQGWGPPESLRDVGEAPTVQLRRMRGLVLAWGWLLVHVVPGQPGGRTRPGGLHGGRVRHRARTRGAGLRRRDGGRLVLGRAAVDLPAADALTHHSVRPVLSPIKFPLIFCS